MRPLRPWLALPLRHHVGLLRLVRESKMMGGRLQERLWESDEHRLPFSGSLRVSAWYQHGLGRSSIHTRARVPGLPWRDEHELRRWAKVARYVWRRVEVLHRRCRGLRRLVRSVSTVALSMILHLRPGLRPFNVSPALSAASSFLRPP